MIVDQSSYVILTFSLSTTGDAVLPTTSCVIDDLALAIPYSRPATNLWYCLSMGRCFEKQHNTYFRPVEMPQGFDTSFTGGGRSSHPITSCNGAT